MNSTEPDGNIYRTSDTAIAAYLISNGYDYPEVEFENGYRAYFVFNDPKPDLEAMLRRWDTQQAAENKFHNAYQSLIRRVKER